MEIKTEGHFSAGHIVDGQTKCNRLHGHNWKVLVVMNGDIDPSTGMVEDFITIKKIIDEWDHQMLLSNTQVIGETITANDNGSYSVIAGGRNYTLPRDVCVILKIPFVTAENLAQLIAEKIYESSPKKFIQMIKVTVMESNGSEAIATIFS